MPQFRIIATILFALIATPLNAETNGVLRIGVLNDMSSVYSDFQGPGSVVAAQMAIEDFDKQSKRKVEVTSGDHQNKPDIGAGIARRWLDVEGVDMIIDLPNSAVALAVGDIVREKNKVAIGSGAGTALLTGAKCSPNFVHWTYDTWAMGHGFGARRARAKAARPGSSSPRTMRSGTISRSRRAKRLSQAVARSSEPSATRLAPSDFSSFLLQAQASGAEVIALANAGGDTTNSVKQAAEFKIGEQTENRFAYLRSAERPGAWAEYRAGTDRLNAFYWDMNDQTREWSKRFQERHAKKMMPNHMHAGVYAAVLHYLKAVDKVGSPADGAAVVAAMKTMPTEDPLFGKGTIRADGRKVHPMYLLEVKTPANRKANGMSSRSSRRSRPTRRSGR